MNLWANIDPRCLRKEMAVQRKNLRDPQRFPRVLLARDGSVQVCEETKQGHRKDSTNA